MLVNDYILVKDSRRTGKFFIEKGYISIDGYFNVYKDDMNSTNRTKVDCICFICKIQNTISWFNYSTQINKNNIYTCHKCHFYKTKIEWIKNHNTDNVQSLDYVRDKLKNTNLEKYGVECVFQNDDIKNKIKNTNLERYGVEYSISSDIVREKIIKTFNLRYNTSCIFNGDSPFREDINEKLKIILNSTDIKDKKANTCLDKYGFKNPMQSEEVKQKSVKTCLEKYGTEYALQSEEVKQKSVKTCLEKYGTEYYSKTLDWFNKTKETRINNDSQISDDLKTEYQIYRYKVDHLTKKNKLELFKNWNGFDYYDNEDISDNFKYHYSNKLYPTIDHKISVINGFISKIDPIKISDLSNLCITKRSINSSKRNKNEENFFLK